MTPASSQNRTIAACSCGSVELEASGAPITSVVCYCDDCQKGSRDIESLPNAAPVLDPDGGTAYIVYRKDRIRCSRGAALLKSHKIRVESVTNRVFAACCNSAMFLNFDDSKHWVDVYRARLRGQAPPVQMRLCTKFRRAADEIPNDVPNHPMWSFRLLAKLLIAGLAMRLTAFTQRRMQ
jgi:hypothetical protein